MQRRGRTGYLVLAVVLGHVILISAQVNAQPGDTVLETVTFGLFSEAQRLLVSARDRVRAGWTSYVDLRNVREENAALQGDLDRMRLALQQQRAVARRAESLERLLDLRRTADLPTLSARVIATDATPWFRTMTVDRGLRDGVRANLAVIAPDGIVGRIVASPGARAAQVQLVIDRNAAVGAMVERTRVSGVVVGSDSGGGLRLDYVANLEDVRLGDRIVTSGSDGIYPKGFAIGEVTDVAAGTGLYQVIHVDPIVAFAQLEDVLIVLDPETRSQVGREEP